MSITYYVCVCVCVCSLRYPNYHPCPVRLCNIFLPYLTNVTIFGWGGEGEFIEHNICFEFLRPLYPRENPNIHCGWVGLGPVWMTRKISPHRDSNSWPSIPQPVAITTTPSRPPRTSEQTKLRVMFIVPLFLSYLPPLPHCITQSLYAPSTSYMNGHTVVTASKCYWPRPMQHKQAVNHYATPFCLFTYAGDVSVKRVNNSIVRTRQNSKLSLYQEPPPPPNN